MKIEVELTERQQEAWDHLTSPVDADVCYGGAKGGGKSFLFDLWAAYWTCWLIKFWDLPKSDTPLPVGFIGRKQAVNFEKTTLETFKKLFPPTSYRIRDQKKEIIINERAKIYYGGLDDSKNIEKFNSAELAFIAIDQAEECDRDDVSVLEASLRLTYRGKTPPYKILYTANPRDCFLKYDFVRGARLGAKYVPALPKDNPHLPGNYEATLEKSFGDQPDLLKAYKDGDWDVMTSDRVVIPSLWIDQLENIQHMPKRTAKLLTIDPSAGGDEAPLLMLDNYEIIDSRYLRTRDVMQIVSEGMIMCHQHNCNHVANDQIGLGEGVHSRFIELGKETFGIKTSRESSNKKKFANLRAEIWWHARELIRSKSVPYPKDKELRRQLAAVQFLDPKGSEGVIELERKSKTKDRLGCSPDRADAYVQGLWIMSTYKDEIAAFSATPADNYKSAEPDVYEENQQNFSEGVRYR